MSWSEMRILLLVVLAGCVGGADTRPETAAYISQAIIVPNCGRAACHSGATAAHGIKLDTVQDSIAAMSSATGRRGRLVTPGDSARSDLYQVIIGQQKVMPPDAPLSDPDIALIKSWIDGGADGL